MKESKLVTLMKASNIFGRGFGERKIQPILDKYPDILTSKKSQTAKTEEVASVEGIGPVSAPQFVKYISVFVQFLKDIGLENKLKKTQELKIVKDTTHPLYGKSIIMTGFRDKDLTKDIENAGGKIGSAVSKNTFAVLVKDKDEDTGKAGQAKKLKIPLMLPEEFRKKYL